MPTATTAPDPTITDVFAEHGVGYDRFSGGQVPTTFLFGDAGKRVQLGWRHGHLAHGSVLATEFYGKSIRINLISAQRVAA